MSLTFQRVYYDRSRQLRYAEGSPYDALCKLHKYLFGLEAGPKDAARLLKKCNTPMIACRALFTHMLRLRDDNGSPIDFICKSRTKDGDMMGFADDPDMRWDYEYEEDFRPTFLQEAYVAKVALAAQEANPVVGCANFFAWCFSPLNTTSRTYYPNGLPKEAWVGTVYKEARSEVPRFCRIMAEVAMREINGDPLSYILRAAKTFNAEMEREVDLEWLVQTAIPVDALDSAIVLQYTHIAWNSTLTRGYDSQWFTVWRADGSHNYARLCYDEEDAPYLAPFHKDWIVKDLPPPAGSDIVDDRAEDVATRQDAEAVWQKALPEIKGQLPPSTYDVFFPGLTPYALRNGSLTLQAKDIVTKNQVDRANRIVTAAVGQHAPGTLIKVEVANVT